MIAFMVADAARLPLADQSVDLVFGSPPYQDARTYGIGATRPCAEWVEWMLEVSLEALRVCRGPVLWVVAGVQRRGCYQPGPEGLLWEWWRRGYGEAWRPCYWYRSGIPGSGGRQWFRGDVEYVLCLKRPGPLPWADPVAVGAPPKYPPGGGPTYRDREGRRAQRRYEPPALANPGTLVRVPVGGGHLGSWLAHENEAPFPERLAEHFIRALCRPGGVVLDPFSGSGTTAVVAARLGRHGIGLDLRLSQAELGRRRWREQAGLFAAADALTQEDEI